MADDLTDAQHGSGAYPDIAPRLGIGWAGAPAWADAGVIVPWTLRKMYGDTEVLDRHFGAMTRYMEYLERANPGYLRTRELGNDYGDWLLRGEHTPGTSSPPAYWGLRTALMTEIATGFGRPDEPRTSAAAGTRRGFAGPTRRRGRPTSGDTQTVYVLALHMDLLPERCAGAARASSRTSPERLPPHHRLRRRRVFAARC